MAYYIYEKGKKVSIEIRSKEISSGGQGVIYEITSPYEYRNYCLKIYKDAKHAEENKNKIEYMVLNPPSNIDMHNIRICWPLNSVYDKRDGFIGFLMRLAFPHSRDLKILSIYSVGKTIAEKYPKNISWHNKFELENPDGVRNRMKMLHNWALAVELIHNTGKYVIVDIKPDNVLATSNGQISIVDADSFQIKDKANIYKGPVATPEYFPKFAKNIELNHGLQTTDCDSFALAVSFYKILVGSHPYSGFKLKAPYNTDAYADIASHIEEDLYVFGTKQQYIELLAKNNMHERFSQLPKDIRNLFNQSFIAHKSLPTATSWKNAFKQILSASGDIKPHTNIDINSSYNSEMRCLCTLVIDVSGSMRLCINGLNSAINKFVKDLIEGENGFSEVSKDILELAIIPYDDEIIEPILSPTLVTKYTKLPTLRVRGLRTNTCDALRRAIDLVNKRKLHYKSIGIPYYRPWIILLTDGNPNPMDMTSLKTLSSQIKSDTDEQKYMFTAIGIGSEIDKRVLSLLSNDNYSIISRDGFSKFFQFLSASIPTDGRNDPQEDLLGELESSYSVEL